MRKQLVPLAVAALAVSLLAASCDKKPAGDAMDKDAAMKKEAMMKNDAMEKDAMMKKDEMMKKDAMASGTKTWTKEEMMAMEKEDAMMKKDGAMASGTTGDMMKKDAMMKDEMMKKDAMMSAGSYKDYSVETVTTEQAMGHKVVLFFHATWCPTCKAADAAFRANLSKIPAGVTVLETDYDSEKALKTKYGVTYQHTFVQIDKNGNKVTAWNSGDIDMLIANLK